MNATRLFELSGIKNDPDFDEVDFAVPFDGVKYPYDGLAISVYWKNGRNAGFSVESYERLAELAIERKKFKPWEVDELLEVAKGWRWQADALKKYADANNLAGNWQI